MYNCERLAQGNAGGFIKRGTVSHTSMLHLQKENNIHPIQNRFDIYEFRNPHQYSTIEEVDLDRPIGKLYVSRQTPKADTIKQKNSTLVKKLTPTRRKERK